MEYAPSTVNPTRNDYVRTESRQIKFAQMKEWRRKALLRWATQKKSRIPWAELGLEQIQTQMTQKLMLRAEVGRRVRCAKNKASAS